MLHALILSIIPTIVGICTLTVLDEQLGNLSRERFERLFKNKALRALTLFAAAYAANGNRVLPAVVALYLYFAITGDDNGDDFSGWEQLKGSWALLEEETRLRACPAETESTPATSEHSHSADDSS